MKRSLLYIILFLCLFVQTLFAQTAAQMASELNRLIGKIETSDTTHLDIGVLDTINFQVDRILAVFAKKSPIVLSEAFRKIGAPYSNDNRLSILSWDTQMGGTQHFFSNDILYDSGKGFKLIQDTTEKADSFSRYYDKIYTLKTNNKVFYLATYESDVDLNERIDGIQVFSIENGVLNDKTRIIKTTKGLNYKISYRYYTSMNTDEIFQFDEKSQTITFPLVDQKHHKTNDTISYKFNGQYFVKSK